MINKKIKQGKTATGGEVVGYLLDKKRHYGMEPEVMRGDPHQTIKNIDNIQNKIKYTSGVLSFAENIDDKIAVEIMDEFEKTAFGELSTYDILWVKHSDHGRTELHYVVPRVDLESGLALNIDPPGKKSMARWNSFRDYVNSKYNLADPTDLNRKRTVKVPGYLQKTSDIRENIAENVTLQIVQGKVKNFSELKSYIQTEFKVEIKRETKTGISITNPNAGADEKDIRKRNIRLIGDLFTEEKFCTAAEVAAQNFQRKISEDIGLGSLADFTENFEPGPGKIAKLKSDLEFHQKSWNTWICNKYKINTNIEEIENEHRTYENVRKFECELSNVSTETGKRIRITESENQITKRENYKNRVPSFGINSDHDTQIEQIRINFNRRQKRRQKRNQRRSITKYIVGFWQKINRIGSKIESLNRVKIQNYKIRKIQQKIKSYAKTTVQPQNKNQNRGMKM